MDYKLYKIILKNMSTNTDINLVDTFKIFRKNIKLFIIIMSIGTIIGITAAVFNTKLDKGRTSIKTTVRVINPFDNYNLVKLQTIGTKLLITENITKPVSIPSELDSIEEFILLTSQYKDLTLSHLTFLTDNVLDRNNYKISIDTLIDDKNIFMVLSMNDIKEIKSAEKDIQVFIDGLNNTVTPMIYKNIEQENRFIRNVLNTKNIEQLVFENFKIVYNMRQGYLSKILGNKIKFYNSYSVSIGQTTENKNLIISSILASLCLFLLLIIIKK